MDVDQNQSPWDRHYTRERSSLGYPDENLVRLIATLLRSGNLSHDAVALDLGSGSGRHCSLLCDFGIPLIIGADISYNALVRSRKDQNASFIQADNRAIPLHQSSVDIIIAWGSLHYNVKDTLPKMLHEIHRVLKPGGHLLTTLRSTRDTFLKRGKNLGNNVWSTDLKDIEGATVSFYTSKELIPAFANFTEMTYGLIERSIMGDLDKTISHWILHAQK